MNKEYLVKGISKVIENKILILIILFSFFEPDFIKAITIIHKLFNYIRLISFILIILYSYLSEIKFSKTFKLILLFYEMLLLTTIINKADLFSLLSDSIPIVSFTLFLEILLSKNIQKTLEYLTIVFSTLVYLNLLFLFIFPNGYLSYFNVGKTIATRYFLGNRNQFAPILFPGILVSIIYSELKCKKMDINTKLLIIVVIITLIKVKSATSLVGLFMILAYLLLAYKKKMDKYVNGKILSIIYIFSFMFIIVLRKQEIFTFLIKDILRKDLTFSTRTKIWDSGIEMIKKSLLVGYGQMNNNRYISVYSGLYRDAHNIILQLFLKGGAVSVISFLSIVYSSLYKLSKSNHHIAKLIIFFIFVMFIMMLMEVYPLGPIFMIFIFGAYNQKFIISN